MASAAWDNSVRIWEGRTGKFVATLRGHVGAVYRLAWSADARMLISASKDSTLKVRPFVNIRSGAGADVIYLFISV